MNKPFAAIAALLLATAILYTGNGLQSTLLSVRANIENFPTALIGTLMSVYFIGFIAGCRMVPAMIRSNGHIRTFVALASIASASALAHSIFVDVTAWMILRGISGFCFAGLAMVLESWINERADNTNRGRVLSVYRIVDLSAQTIGNGLLSIANPADFQLFALISILVSVALVPIALTRSEAPTPPVDVQLSLRRLFAISPVAAAGALTTGLANAGFWAMGPVFVQQIGFGADTVAIFMSAVIIGAACFQWPLGWISDQIDRRIVLAVTSALGVVASIFLVKLDTSGKVFLLALGFSWGAAILPTFGLSVAHANDQAEPGTSVATNGGLLMLHGVGSVFGATAAAIIMSVFGPSALFTYIAAIYCAFFLTCVLRIVSSSAVPADQKLPFSPVPKGATPGVFEIAEDDDDENAPEKTQKAADTA